MTTRIEGGRLIADGTIREGLCLYLEDGLIAEISERAGFNNYRTFTRCFRKFYDMSPSEYRRNMEETR